MSKAAKEGELQSLHAALAKTLAEAVIETEIKIVDIPDESAEGGTRKVAVRTRNAAVLNAARQFLKDNNIACAPGHPSKDLRDLDAAVGELPFEGSPYEGLDDSKPTH